MFIMEENDYDFLKVRNPMSIPGLVKAIISCATQTSTWILMKLPIIFLSSQVLVDFGGPDISVPA
jgi:hypothetical protein